MGAAESSAGRRAFVLRVLAGPAAFAIGPLRSAGRTCAGGAPRPCRLRLGRGVVGNDACAVGSHQLPAIRLSPARRGDVLARRGRELRTRHPAVP